MKKLTIAIIAVSIIMGASLAAQSARVSPNDDAAFLAPAHAVIQQVKKGRPLTLVDVRSKAEFETVHITGSINVPLHFVKTKTYLKPKAVILVNAGFARRELVDACRGLRQLGFDARILAGGLLAWHGKSGKLSGDLTRLQAYTRITPAVLYREIDTARIVAVDVSPESNPEAKALFGGTIHIPYGTPAFQKAMQRKIKKESQARLVVYNQHGEDYLNVESALDRAGAGRVFYLAGGLAAYKTYSENYALLHRPREERVKSTPCNNCGPVQSE